MANRYRDDHNYDSEDSLARHIRQVYRGRNTTNLANISLFSERTESIIEHNRHYNENQRNQYFPAGPSLFPDEGEQNVRPTSFIGVFPFLRNLFCFGLIFAFLGILSFGEYSILYNAIMSPLCSTNLLYFDYTTTGIANHLMAQIPSHTSTGATGTSTEKEALNATTYEEENECNIYSFSKATNTVQEFGSPWYSSPLHPSKNSEVEKTYQELLQSAPFAVVDLFSNHISWQHYHPDVIPKTNNENRILKTGVHHYIEIILDLPESNTNLEKVGMFSIIVDLHSSSSGIADKKSCNNTNTNTNTIVRNPKLLATSTRTARMPHESFWITVVRKVICIVPYVLGAIPESRRVIIPSFRFFVESEEYPLRYITVRLLVSPQKAQRGDMVEVVQGMLNIGEELTEIQLLLKEWFFTCMMIGTSLLFYLQLVFVVAIRFAFIAWYELERDEDQDILEDVSEVLNLDGLNDEDDGDDFYSDPNSRDQPFNNFDPERRSNHDQQQSNRSVENVEGEQGEWEDLIQRNSGIELNSRQNEEHDGNREIAATNLEPIHSPPATVDGASHHYIPDN